MLKKLIWLIIAVIAVVAVVRSGVLDSLRPKRITFDAIVGQFEKDGFTVTDRSSTSLINGAVDGEEMRVSGTLVRMFEFIDSGRLSIEYENYKPGAGDAIAERMGITTQLGVQSRPVSGPQTYPAKKGLYLLIVHTDDKSVAKEVLDSFSRL
jgi:hypothetical protein